MVEIQLVVHVAAVLDENLLRHRPLVPAVVLVDNQVEHKLVVAGAVDSLEPNIEKQNH